MQRPVSQHFAMIVVALAGLAWGVFWIPLRALDNAGISGVWAVVLFYVVPAIVLSPVVFLRRHQIAKAGWPLQVSGILAGLALVLYAVALVFTDVVRALLFFYLTPLWSTFLSRIFLGEKITAIRWVTIVLAFGGLLLILKVDTFSASLSLGDWMGLASGVIWAIAAVCIQSDTQVDSVDVTLFYFLWGSLVALVLIVLPFDGARAMPEWNTILSVLPWFVPVAIVLVIPISHAVMWGATVLSPGLLAILFMTEISAGTVTAAIWANEPFGLRELAGVILITSAGVLEPITTLRRSNG